MTQAKRTILAMVGIVVMIAAFSLMWHTVIDLWQPLPIWQLVLLWVGAIIIMMADPVSYTAGRMRRY